jgi:hypothetical protein
MRPKPLLTGITISHAMTLYGPEATVTANNHGYADGNIVVVAGADGPDGALYNGTFSIHGVSQNQFKYYMVADPGANATGTLTCTLDPYEFDALMRSLPVNTTIHLGPGTFETKGFCLSAPAIFASWQPKSGWRIVGSGIDVTVLKVVEATIPDAHYFGIGTIFYNSAYRLNGFDVSDLTVDSNLPGQPVPAGKDFAPIICGAILAAGSYIRIRRVRAINFGGQSFAETFVIAAGYGTPDVPEVVDCVIEECICEQPFISNKEVTTVINIGAGERSTDGVTTWHRACAVRNCVVDCEYKVNPVPISQITFTGTTATVTTIAPHGRAANDWVRIAGALVNGSIDNPFNGSFQITSITSTTLQYTMAATPAASPLGQMWVDRFSSHYVPITTMMRSGTGPWTITVTTGTPHFRVPGNNVVINQAAPLAYNGSFKITNVLSPTQLQFVLATDLGDPTAWSHIGVQFQAISNDAGTGAVVEGNRIFNCRVGGPYHDTYTTKDILARNNHYRGVVVGIAQGLGVIYGFGLSTTSDYIPMSLARSGANAVATTTKQHGFVAISDFVRIAGVTGPDAELYNGRHQVTAVPNANTFQYFAGVSNDPTGSPGYATDDRQRILNSLTYTLENGVYVATAQISTAYSAHGFAVGDSVKISKITGQTHNEYFNDYHTITSVTPTTFKFSLPGDPNPGSGSDSGSSPSGYYGRLWQVGRVVIEDNVIELVPTATNYGPPIAIELDYASFVVPPLFRQVVIRRNVIRHVDGASDPPGMAPGVGIQVSGCGDLILEENVVDLDAATPITYKLCDKARFFNNQTSAGTLIQAYDSLTSVRANELATDIEDVLLLAL